MKSERGYQSASFMFALTLLLLLSGCATYEECDVAYLTPSTKAIPGRSPKVNLMLRTTYGLDTASPKILAALNRALSIQKGLTLTNRGKADYIICLDLFYVQRKDASQSVPYNTHFELTPIDSSKSSGTQRIQKTTRKTSLGSLIANVSLYRAGVLEPVTYFSLVNYMTLQAPLNGRLPTDNKVAAKLAYEIVMKIKEMMVTDYRTIKTILPNNGDAALLERFKSIRLAKRPVSGAPTAKELFSKMLEEMRTYKERFKENPKAKEKCLSDYYIKFLMNERGDITAENLKLLHRAYTCILESTDNEGLILGCANSLGRIENKTARLGVAIDD